MSDRDLFQVPWEEADHKAWQQQPIEVYTAQVDRMDQGIGRIVQSLNETEQLDNTLIEFLADKGGCVEELGGGMRRSAIAPPTTRDGRPVQHGNDPNPMPGDETTY